MCGIWGTTWLAIKFSLQFVPPIFGAGLRFVIAGLFLYVVAAARGYARPPRELPWPLVAVLATMLFGFNYIMTYVSETRLDSGLVAVLFGTFPFFMFAFGHYLAHERTTPRTWLGALVAFAGVAVISLGAQVGGSPLYALAAIVAAASAAFANAYAKRHAHHEPLTTLPPSMLLAGVGVGTIGLFTENVRWAQVVSPPSVWSLLYLSIVGSSVAFFLNLWVLQRLPGWVVGLSALIIPVIAVIVGILVGGEHFTYRELAGSALVIAGIWIALSSRKEAAEAITLDEP